MTKLKPCPFCGGEALLNEFPVRKGYEASIQCDGGCYCFALMTTITYDFPDQAREAVIAAWNRRDGEQIMRLIDVDAAKAELLCVISITEDIHARSGFFDGIRVGYKRAADRLDTMPTVEERKQGHWIEKNLGGNTSRTCSCCKTLVFTNSTTFKYCPYCGAKMEGE